MSRQFLLSSDECELLLEFEASRTIEKTAQAMHRDPSGVSRQLAAIAKRYPALEKRAGRWVLTETGRRLNSYTRNSIQVQKHLAEVQSVIRIGTNREFGARVIGPAFEQLRSSFPNSQLMLLTFEHGTEEPLLNGRIDIGIDCDRPKDPDIGYKMLVREPIVAVCSPRFRKKYEKEIRSQQLYRTPHLLCERLHPDKVFSEPENRLNVIAFFNDIAAARAACLAAGGWALLPKYAVRDELQSGALVLIGEKSSAESRYGVWWSRTRHLPKETVQSACDWLKKQDL